MRHPRLAIASLALSAVGLVSLALEEDFACKAKIPVPGDVPTLGFGSTKREDGSPVQMGDTITPPKALARTLGHIQKDEAGLKRCVTAPLNQVEYDILVKFAYQYGTGAACKSTLVKLINAGRYTEACEQYARWTFVAGKDCAAPGSGCRGVVTRANERRDMCMEAQS